MRKRDYDKMYEQNTGNTETHEAVDEHMRHEDRLHYEEGFASASGIRPETAASGGRIRTPERNDGSRPDRVPDSIEEENPGLAES